VATILLGVTGSIAAYKAADLASKLAQAGHDVTAIMTHAATQLVSPNTFLNLTGNRVYTDLWDPHGQTEHIALTDRAELVVLAPATANALAKMAHGLADDMLHTTLLAVRCPVLICPAMNTRMWENPVVQGNLQRIRELDRFHVMEPGAGNLACGHTGAGRLPEPAEIAARVEALLAGSPPAPRPPHVDAIVLTCADLETSAAFYRELGLPLKHEDHGEGPVHYACDLGPVHVALFAADEAGTAPSRRAAGSGLVGLQVASVEDAFARAVAAGGEGVQEPADFPWGRRALVKDPDGRVVELNHAPPRG
jgi:predicted enzyme related to lactoylglutathione lyase/3-polyprenyl-4-hydroxybenzoate decarboxylase